MKQEVNAPEEIKSKMLECYNRLKSGDITGDQAKAEIEILERILKVIERTNPFDL